MASGTSKWLLPNNGFLISNYKLINESNPYEKDYEVINRQTLVIVFNRNGQGYTAYIDLNNFNLAKEIALPKIK